MPTKTTVSILHKAIFGMTTKTGGNFFLGEDCPHWKAIGIFDQLVANFRDLFPEKDISPDLHFAVILHPRHGTRVHVQTKKQGGGAHIRADAAIVREGRSILSTSGGCPFFSFQDAAKGLNGLVHAGWKSVAGGIFDQFTKYWKAEGGNVAATTAYLSPHICGNCLIYPRENFDRDVAPKFQTQAAKGFPLEKYLFESGDSISFDLASYTTHLLEVAGFKIAPNASFQECTCCGDTHHCYRHDDTPEEKFRNAVFLCPTTTD